ncbi:MAG: tetratricopeptide repeat protein [Candidatus Marinimicrobia bacterium]|nr:tetratricopeptide repeat protein [FCB group bacterium]MBL7024891.1 tetratricopeptide repeat protein [Candidatus Neomarinimicrobiota bacterium]
MRYFQNPRLPQSFIVTVAVLLSLSGMGKVLAADPDRTLINKVDELQNILEEVKTRFPIDSSGVEETFDSLIVVLQGYKPHLAYIQYYQGMFYFNRRNLEQAKIFQASALGLARKSGNDQLTAKIFIQLGVLESAQGNNSASIKNYLDGVEAATRAGDHRTMGACYSLLGNIHRIMGEYEEAINYITKAETHYTEIGFNEGAAWIQYSLANIYKDLELHDEALDYLYKSLDTYEREVKDSLGVAICLDQIGDIYFGQKLYGKAQEFVLRSYKIHSTANNSHGLAITLKNLGKIEYELKNFPKAIDYLEQSRVLKQSGKDVLVLTQIYEYMGRSLYDMGQQQAGIDTAKTGLKLATDSQQRRMENRLYGVLADMYREQGDLENAYDYLAFQTSSTQRLADRLASVKITGMKNFHDREARRQEINTLHFENHLIKVKLDKQRTTQLLLAAVIFSILVFSFILIFMYLSKRKTLQVVDAQRNELERLVATKNKFFSIISHDLRSPLGGTMQLMETAIELFPTLSRDKILDLLTTMSDTTRNTFRLLENLLVWSRFQTGVMQVNMVEENLGKLIHHELSLHENQAREKNISLSSAIDDDIVVFADSDMVGTILRNLISNAIKFTRPGGEVKISASRADSHVFVSVTDNGIGIPEAEHANIFTLENELKRNGTNGEPSSGLGLILVKEFVDELGGSITVESVPDEGTAFTFSLKSN